MYYFCWRDNKQNVELLNFKIMKAQVTEPRNKMGVTKHLFSDSHAGIITAVYSPTKIEVHYFKYPSWGENEEIEPTYDVQDTIQVFVYENVFNELDEETQKFLVEFALQPVWFDSEKGKVNIERNPYKPLFELRKR